MHHETREKAATADAEDTLGLPPELLALLPPAGQPHVRQSRWSHEDACPVWADPTRDGRPYIPEALRDKIAEHTAPRVLRALRPVSRVAVFGMAAGAKVEPWTQWEIARRLREVYRLDDVADARAKANGHGASTP